MSVSALNCPKCGSPLEQIEVLDRTFVHSCPHCAGTFYTEAELAVPLKLQNARAAKWKCPSCGSPMTTGTVYDGHLELDRCDSCGGFWFDAGEVETLRHLAGVEQIIKPADAAPPLEEPQAPAAAEPSREPPRKAQAPAPTRKAKTAPAHADGASAAAGGAAVPASDPDNPDSVKAPRVALDGRTYSHFQTSLPVTTAVLGEFPWVAKVGDTVTMRDFVSPPYLLSEEVSNDEIVWTLGEYVEPEEVWAAFQLPGAPPPKKGISPAQPNPWGTNLRPLWRAFAAAAAVCIGTYLWQSGTALRRDVFQGEFQFKTADPEKSRVTDLFEIPGGTANVEMRFDTNLDNHWAYFDVALINADTSRAYDFGQELSHYSGVDDGEVWNEGSQWETVYVPQVPAGRYYLRVEPETDAPVLSLRVRLRRDVPLLRLPLIALLLLLLPPLLVSIRSTVFENARWIDSDHAPSSGDDE
jgi:Zn-finger nucleic acid-binding protein